MLLMATAFRENVPKHGAWCKRCSLKYAENFNLKSWWNRTESFAMFTFHWHLCALRKLFGEINSLVSIGRQLASFDNVTLQFIGPFLSYNENEVLRFIV
jgi:hypothetical protein